MLPTGAGGHRCVTASERYLADLCERSFLRLWSHPNVFKKKNHELCDLLVVFGGDVIVFQDKSCTYGTGPLAWERWYRRSVLAARKNLYEAARWIRRYPSQLFLDPRCSVAFPFAVPEKPRIHLVAVTLGAAEACRRHFHGGSGSLAIAPALPGECPDPFHVNDPDRDKDYVHVFDEVTLALVMGELDTVDDFVSYLSAKERFVRAMGFIMADGEEDLLAYYLTHKDPNTGKHDFTLEPNAYVAIENYWSGLSAKPEYKAKKEADEISYLWDRIIDYVADGAIAGDLTFEQPPGLRSTEELLRVLARESRLARRSLAKALLGVLNEAVASERVYRVAKPGDRPDIMYVFIALRRGEWCRSEEHYREHRSRILGWYMKVAKLYFPEVELAVGLAFGGTPEADRSVDCMALRFSAPWSEAERAEVEAVREQMGWPDVSGMTVGHMREHEFPAVPTNTPAERGATRKRDRPNATRRKKQARKAHKAARRRNR